ncbi:MAG: nucleotidyl transferase AbiEii/AbiGii toxin family protein [Nanoarchaeota archaeon]
MDLLQLREKEIFETLKKIGNFKFVVIGGYAVNAYALPRFSVDCDIVLENDNEAKRIGKELEKSGYKKENAGINNAGQYSGKFVRYEKQIQKNFRVSIDILIGNVFDRNTNASFSARWAFENSIVRLVKGKTIPEKLTLRVISTDALIVMKFISCRTADIRDVFMLMPQAKDTNWVKKEISDRYDFKDRFEKIRDKISSAQFKNNLEGVYGYIDKIIFEKHKKAILELK